VALNVAVGVLDRDRWDANTDNLVVVETPRRRLTWVPRDLWCERLRDRVNRAFALGGASLLAAALADHGLDADEVVVVRRGATERALEPLSITVPVQRTQTFLYPLAPTSPIEDGHRVIRFEPPSEVLAGERLHQWLGARMVPVGAGSDLDRIARQRIFLRCALEQGARFDGVLADPTELRATSRRALEALATVRPGWTSRVVDDVVARTIEGKAVLVRDRGPAAPLRALRRTVRR